MAKRVEVPSAYVGVPLTELVGKKIRAVVSESDEDTGEPCITLLFTDGTKHRFILPSDDN